jgi:hypothetical protein
MRVLLQIRKSGESDLSEVNAKRYEQIGRITELIREIDDEIRGGKTQKPRYGRRLRKKG